jgi:large subunit ribosomal protein L20
MAKGFSFDRRTKYYQAAETVLRAMKYQYISRRLLKRDMRQLWIARISAATKLVGGNYSKFIHALKVNGSSINRKMLAEIAARDFEGFKAIYSSVMK